MASNANSTAMNGPAMNTVFTTTELLESIFMQMTTKDLLFAQQVCRRWKELVTESPQLQQRLFFRAAMGKDLAPTINDLLSVLFFPLTSLESLKSPSDLPELNDIKHLPWFIDEQRRRKVLNENASWRRMYPVQPPAKIDQVIHRFHAMGGDSEYYGPLNQDLEKEQANGARMGLIYDVLTRVIDGDTARSGARRFYIRWHMMPLAENYYSDDRQAVLRHMERGYGGLELENKITIYLHETISCVIQAAPPESGLVVPDAHRHSEDKFVEFAQSTSCINQILEKLLKLDRKNVFQTLPVLVESLYHDEKEG